MTFGNGQLFSDLEWDELIETLSLPRRQAEVVKYIFEGRSDTQIADNMKISVPTVRTHISRLFDKFELQDRNELLRHVFKTFREGCPEGCPRQECHHGGCSEESGQIYEFPKR